MAHAVRGFPLLLVYSGGFSAICPICRFNASVRRFNVWCYLYTAVAPRVLWPLFVSLWRVVVPCSVARRLRCQLAAVLVHLWLCRRLPPAPAVRSRWLLRRAWRSGKVAGIVVPLCAKVAVKVASACAKVAYFTPKS